MPQVPTNPRIGFIKVHGEVGVVCTGPQVKIIWPAVSGSGLNQIATASTTLQPIPSLSNGATSTIGTSKELQALMVENGVTLMTPKCVREACTSPVCKKNLKILVANVTTPQRIDSDSSAETYLGIKHIHSKLLVRPLGVIGKIPSGMMIQMVLHGHVESSPELKVPLVVMIPL